MKQAICSRLAASSLASALASSKEHAKEDCDNKSLANNSGQWWRTVVEVRSTTLLARSATDETRCNKWACRGRSAKPMLPAAVKKGACGFVFQFCGYFKREVQYSTVERSKLFDSGRGS